MGAEKVRGNSSFSSIEEEILSSISSVPDFLLDNTINDEGEDSEDDELIKFYLKVPMHKSRRRESDVSAHTEICTKLKCKELCTKFQAEKNDGRRRSSISKKLNPWYKETEQRRHHPLCKIYCKKQRRRRLSPIGNILRPSSSSRKLIDF